jgi:hypothetical protein
MGLWFLIGRKQNLLDAGVGKSELASAPLYETISSLVVSTLTLPGIPQSHEQCSSLDLQKAT